VKLEPIAFGKQVPLSVRYEGERGKAGGSGFVSAVVEEHPEAVESEPNDTPESATRLPALPVALSGRFDRPNDRDFYQLPVKMGDRLTFAARTRSLGSPCDVRLVVFKPDGSKLAESKVEGASEGSLDATFPDDGPYRLLVEEINRAGGPGLAYRVVVEPYKPGFALAVDTDRVSAKPGESFEVKVTSVRRDYAGPIALAVDSGGLTSEPATIPAGKNEAVLKGNVPTGKQPGGPLPALPEAALPAR